MSVGSDTYIRFSTAASAIYGLCNRIGLDQIFPVNAHNRRVYGLQRFNARCYTILSMIRNPQSGGKPQDFERWALETTSEDTALSLSSSMISLILFHNLLIF